MRRRELSICWTGWEFRSIAPRRDCSIFGDSAGRCITARRLRARLRASNFFMHWMSRCGDMNLKARSKSTSTGNFCRRCSMGIAYAAEFARGKNHEVELDQPEIAGLVREMYGTFERPASM